MTDTAKAFAKLSGRYGSYKELLEALQQVWIEHRNELPPEVRANDLFDVARRNNWVKAKSRGTITIKIPKKQRA